MAETADMPFFAEDIYATGRSLSASDPPAQIWGEIITLLEEFIELILTDLNFTAPSGRRHLRQTAPLLKFYGL
jgi:hypothetical protein